MKQMFDVFLLAASLFLTHFGDFSIVQNFPNFLTEY